MTDLVNDRKKELIANFVEKGLLPYWQKEKYIQNLSTRKLIKIAERILALHIPFYSASEAIYEEMIKRLKKEAEIQEFCHKIKPDIFKRIDERMGL